MPFIGILVGNDTSDRQLHFVIYNPLCSLPSFLTKKKKKKKKPKKNGIGFPEIYLEGNHSYWF